MPRRFQIIEDYFNAKLVGWKIGRLSIFLVQAKPTKKKKKACLSIFFFRSQKDFH